MATKSSGVPSHELNENPSFATFMAQSISAVITWSFCNLDKNGICFDGPDTASPPPCDVDGKSCGTLKTSECCFSLA
ncbi:hypothetical protein DPMN_116102 [Dreissena polymorpha]|uniref:Uncharacterized protein n=1 Tax=Dreissena polymorpha TaxID=45954 RepID=A0A9D4KN84_DREPO|nr:hypothetical protein DPMN_116102 [Dreissena polymorpha]